MDTRAIRVNSEGPAGSEMLCPGVRLGLLLPASAELCRENPHIESMGGIGGPDRDGFGRILRRSPLDALVPWGVGSSLVSARKSVHVAKSIYPSRQDQRVPAVQVRGVRTGGESS